jgi:hypothetical protein
MLVFTFLSYVLCLLAITFDYVHKLWSEQSCREVQDNNGEQFCLQVSTLYSYLFNKWMSSSDPLPNNWYGKIWLYTQTKTGITSRCDNWNVYKHTYIRSQAMDTHNTYTHNAYRLQIYNIRLHAICIIVTKRALEIQKKIGADTTRISPTFRRNLLSPKYRLFSSHFLLVPYLTYFSIMKIEAVCRCETLMTYYEGGLISLWLYKENKLRDWKKNYLLYIFPPQLHTLMTSLF